jgi:hypothetical protein
MNGKTDRTDKKVEIRKDWVAPELRKTTIGQITANTRGCKAPDGGTAPNSHAS